MSEEITRRDQDPIEYAINVIYMILVMDFILCLKSLTRHKHVYLEYTQQTLTYTSLVIYLAIVMFMS
jgi:hypothetical protein